MKAITSENLKDSTILGKSVPDSLFKYRSLDIRTLVALAQSKLYLVDFRLFNDPFDCQAGSGLDSLIGFSQKQKLKNEFASLSTFRICSFTAVRDDVLMWGHYADGHKGLCIEFSPAKDEAFKKICFPVEYKLDYPDLFTPHPLLKGAEGHSITKLLLTKSKQWSYEQEWRAIGHASNSRANEYVMELQHSPHALTGIIFGSRMPNDHKLLIRQAMVRYDHVKYFQATTNGSSYSIDISDA